MIKVRLSDGGSITFQDGTSPSDMRLAIERYWQQKKLGIGGVLKKGFYEGLAETPELLAGATSRLEEIIPGKQESLDRLEEKRESVAETIKSKGPAGAPSGLLEKIASGIGAAPGTVASASAEIPMTARLA